MLPANMWWIVFQSCLLLVTASPKHAKFIYTYDLPAKFNTEIPPVPADAKAWTDWYVADKVLHPLLKSHSTSKPEAADLFFIPVYSAEIYHSLLLNSKLSHTDALNGTATLVREALNYVKSNFVHWNRTNGMDHFIVTPLDNGRCHSLAGVPQEEQGGMFMVQQEGDLIQKDFETHTWHCYRPGWDVLIPGYMESSIGQPDIILPNATERNISVLYRFLAGGRGNYAQVRTKLLEHHRTEPIPGSAAGWQTVAQTHEDMKHSIFCVCPPGIAQHTLRMSRSILSGCIPLTQFSAYDSPYQRNLGLDYTRFSININQDELHLLRPMLMGLLARPQRIMKMQRELAAVQKHFLWNQGVFEALLSELAQHRGRFIAPVNR